MRSFNGPVPSSRVLTIVGLPGLLLSYAALLAGVFSALSSLLSQNSQQLVWVGAACVFGVTGSIPYVLARPNPPSLYNYACWALTRSRIWIEFGSAFVVFASGYIVIQSLTNQWSLIAFGSPGVTRAFALLAILAVIFSGFSALALHALINLTHFAVLVARKWNSDPFEGWSAEDYERSLAPPELFGKWPDPSKEDGYALKWRVLADRSQDRATLANTFCQLLLFIAGVAAAVFAPQLLNDPQNQVFQIQSGACLLLAAVSIVVLVRAVPLFENRAAAYERAHSKLAAIESGTVPTNTPTLPPLKRRSLVPGFTRLLRSRGVAMPPHHAGAGHGPVRSGAQDVSKSPASPTPDGEVENG